MAAAGEPNTRSTQFFINKLDENVRLDSLKFAVFGEVVEGMDNVDKIKRGEPVRDPDSILKARIVLQ